MSIILENKTADLLVNLIKLYNNFILERKIYYIYTYSAKLLIHFNLEEPSPTHVDKITKYNLISTNAKSNSLLYFIEWIKIYKSCFNDGYITPLGMKEIDKYIELSTKINTNIDNNTDSLKIIIIPLLDVEHSFLEKYTILNNLFKDYCKICKKIQKSIEYNALLCAKLDILNYKKNIISKNTFTDENTDAIILFNNKYQEYKSNLDKGNNIYLGLVQECFKSYYLHKNTVIKYNKLNQSIKINPLDNINKRKCENNNVPLNKFVS